MPATLNIWYPDSSQHNIGHASLQIGDDTNTAGYVSWWPNGGNAGLLNPTAEGRSVSYATDVASEKCGPHTTFLLVLPLNEVNMLIEWQQIKNKPDAHYKLFVKNCATVVARVLRAGGADLPLNPVERASYAHNLYWSPKNLAAWCALLRDKGLAIKDKKAHCPKKVASKLYVGVGLR